MKLNKENYNEMFKEKLINCNNLLLHVCCAPCLAAALEKLKGINTTCIFYNTNIMPKEEWNLRLESVKKLIECINKGELGNEYKKFSLVVIDYNNTDFLNSVRGKENLGENSERCENCISMRLNYTYKYAKLNKFQYFATTLTSSPHKNSDLINKIGQSIHNAMYIPTDFKKQNGAKASKTICQKLGLYRQHYCGCTFGVLNILTPFKIGKVIIPNRLLLAPMAGYTDVGARYVAKMCGAGLTYTEMVSAKALEHNSEKTLNLLATTEIEIPKAVQLFGHDYISFIHAINNEYISKFDIIDLNMGCPMPKIVRNGEGSALMYNSSLAKDIISKLVQNTQKPITVKFRKFENDEETVNFAKLCENAGASAITIHGRTPKQLYSGVADYEIIKKVVKSVNIPVIVSGDIKSIEHAEEVINSTGAVAVMIGRAAIGNPSIFGKKLDLKSAILNHVNIDIKYLGEKQTFLDIKKHLISYMKGQENASEIRKKLIEINCIDDLNRILEQIK